MCTRRGATSTAIAIQCTSSSRMLLQALLWLVLLHHKTIPSTLKTASLSVFSRSGGTAYAETRRGLYAISRCLLSPFPTSVCIVLTFTHFHPHSETYTYEWVASAGSIRFSTFGSKCWWFGSVFRSSSNRCSSRMEIIFHPKTNGQRVCSVKFTCRSDMFFGKFQKAHPD